MKKIETIIKPFKLDEIKTVLTQEGVQSITISEIQVFNQLDGHVVLYRGATYEMATFPKVKIEVIVGDEVRTITDKIVRLSSSLVMEIVILPMDTTVRTRPGSWLNLSHSIGPTVPRKAYPVFVHFYK
jgi:nitrogen regulatory protein PII